MRDPAETAESRLQVCVCKVFGVDFLHHQRPLDFGEQISPVEEDVAVAQAAQPRLDPLAVGGRGLHDEPIASAFILGETQNAHLIHDAAVGVQDETDLMLAGLQRSHITGHDLRQARNCALAGDE